ncbi:MAG TPA: Arc family DNA-binding protein [Pseudomonas sp.]|nr:Arc family DNA-binding protein [Pseudomonas sp.]
MTYKSRTADKFVVRLPDGMRDKIAEAATTNERSMNSEIVGRISRTFHDDAERQIIIDSMHHLNRQLTQAYEEIERLRAELAKAGDA